MVTGDLASKIKQVLEKEPRVIAAYIIGSMITERETKESDFDLAVVVSNKKLLDENKVYEMVRNISFPKDLDLSVVDQSSSPLFLFQIIKGQRIYQRNAADMAAFEAFALHNYYDTQYLRNIYHEALKNKFSYVH